MGAFLTIKRAEKIIQKNLESDGFTEFLVGPKARYIVAFTNNVIKKDSDIQKVYAQIRKFYKQESLTIGGWRDSKTNLFYLDLWIATDNLEYALENARRWNQIAIFDLIDFVEIRA